MSSIKNAGTHDSVKEVIQSYLKRRNFSAEAEESAADSGTVHSLSELAGDTLADVAASVANVLAHTATQMEPAAAETQFARFRDWILESPEPYQTALYQLLYPVFVSLHVELVLGGHNPARFYARHHGLLCDVERYPLVAVLAGVNTIDQLDRAPLNEFRCTPVEISLSPECSEYLRRSLVSSQLTLVLQSLSQHVRLAPAAVLSAAEADEDPRCRRRYLNGADGVTKTSSTAAEDAGAAGELARAASQLRAQPPTPPTVCSYRLHRTLSCAALCPRLHVLAAGVDDGAAVWSLTADGVSLRPNPAARVPLAWDAGLGGGGGGSLPGGRAPTRTLRAHAGPVYDMAFEPEGALLLTAGEDTTIRAWETENWNNVAIYRGHTYPVWSVACQRSVGGFGHYFVSGSMDRTARLWSYERAHQLRIFSGHTQDVDCVAVHPNGNYVCSASADGTVRLWSLTDAGQARVLSGHRGIVHDLQFSADGKLLAAAGEDQYVRVYDLGAGCALHVLAGHRAPVTCLLWTADSKTLISADQDGVINTWNLTAAASDRGVGTAAEFSVACPGSAAVRLQMAPHNHLVAVYGDRD